MDYPSRLIHAYILIIVLTSPVSTYSCNSYCDHEGEYKDGFNCINSKIPFCCGDAHERFCCRNISLDASHYPAVRSCLDPSLGLLDVGASFWSERAVTLSLTITGFLVAALFCLVCGIRTHCRNRRAAADRARRRENRISEPPPFLSLDEFMYAPPDYDSIPKDPPPAYTEIIGNDNPAFLLSPAQFNDNSRLAGQSYDLQIELGVIPHRNDETLPPYSPQDVSVDYGVGNSPQEMQHADGPQEVQQDSGGTHHISNEGNAISNTSNTTASEDDTQYSPQPSYGPMEGDRPEGDPDTDSPLETTPDNA